VVLDEVGIADVKAGRIDPRVIAVLTKLSQEHKITVSCMCSDHSKFTAGGSISNHYYGARVGHRGDRRRSGELVELRRA
jgi:hypothetical protein